MNDAPVWSVYEGRAMTSLEKIASMGYPVYPSMARTMGVGWHLDYNNDYKSVANARRRIGNSMHLGSIGIVLMAALLSFQDARE